MGLFLALLIRVTFGLICMAIASNKGRSKVGWFFAGFFIGLIGLIIILCLGDVQKKRNFRSSVRKENKRLREKLRQEKMKNKTFREHTRKRLDKHDDELNLDTRDLGEASIEAPEEEHQIAPGKKQQQEQEQGQQSPEGKWYYKMEDGVAGPIKREELEKLVRSGQLTDTTEVLREGWDEWSPVYSIPNLGPSNERG